MTKRNCFYHCGVGLRSRGQSCQCCSSVNLWRRIAVAARDQAEVSHHKWSAVRLSRLQPIQVCGQPTKLELGAHWDIAKCLPQQPAPLLLPFLQPWHQAQHKRLQH